MSFSLKASLLLTLYSSILLSLISYFFHMLHFCLLLIFFSLLSSFIRPFSHSLFLLFRTLIFLPSLLLILLSSFLIFPVGFLPSSNIFLSPFFLHSSFFSLSFIFLPRLILIVLSSFFFFPLDFYLLLIFFFLLSSFIRPFSHTLSFFCQAYF